MKHICAVLLLSSALCCELLAQKSYVAPPAYNATGGTGTFLGPLANAQRTYQLLIHEDQLAGMVGRQLTAISWRNPASATTTWPAADAVYDSYDIYLGPSVAPAARSLTDFSANAAGPRTQVRSGSLLIRANSYPIGGNPNQFGPEITFTQPWTYTGGHLLVELRHTGFTGTSRSVDALTSTTTGYGSQFSACWASSAIGNSGSQGNFSIIRFSSGSSAPTVVAAASRKTHGGAADFDIEMPLAGNTGVESRAGGATSDYLLVVTFAGPVTVGGNPQAVVTSGSGMVGSGGVSNGGAVTVSGSTVAVPLTNVSNAQTINVTLSGVNTGGASGNVVIPMSFLIGDVNGDRLVNVSDALQTRNRSGTTTDATNFRFDVNTDGTINTGDVLSVRNRSGTSLP
jgi:hypothetical protein